MISSTPPSPKEPFVVVTAPHSKTNPDLTAQHSDIISEYAAQSLFDRINYESTLFQANEYRYNIDLNRPLARKTDYRRELTKTLLNVGMAYDGILVDVHSFLSESFSSHDVCILDNSPGTSYGKHLHYLLRANNINTGYDSGQVPINMNMGNDIVDEGRRRGLKAILVEFNETLMLSEIDYINRAIVKWTETEFDLSGKKP